MWHNKLCHVCIYKFKQYNDLVFIINTCLFYWPYSCLFVPCMFSVYSLFYLPYFCIFLLPHQSLLRPKCPSSFASVLYHLYVVYLSDHYLIGHFCMVDLLVSINQWEQLLPVCLTCFIQNNFFKMHLYCCKWLDLTAFVTEHYSTV